MIAYLRRLARRDAERPGTLRPRVVSRSPIREHDQRPDIEGFEGLPQGIAGPSAASPEAAEPMPEGAAASEASGTIRRKTAAGVAASPGAAAPIAGPPAPAPPPGARRAEASPAAGDSAASAPAAPPARPDLAAERSVEVAAGQREPRPGLSDATSSEGPPAAPAQAAREIRLRPPSAGPEAPVSAVSSPPSRRPPVTLTEPPLPRPPAAPDLIIDSGPRRPDRGGIPDREEGAQRPSEILREIHHHTIERVAADEGDRGDQAPPAAAARRPASAEMVSRIGPLAANRRSNLRFALRQR